MYYIRSLLLGYCQGEDVFCEVNTARILIRMILQSQLQNWDTNFG